ncbi:hypothetical protein [Hydrocoleum sp. CS-953]|uniref:hypothetical protein n=1 Tax=Hydrocoleum sp. CS-953 TaxID=1671698 RepID=UPI00117A1834|nr:hypothetical protein [Hydrocoleum sp. CS-953]
MIEQNVLTSKPTKLMRAIRRYFSKVLRTNLNEINLDIMTTNVNFGVVLEINGEDVAIEPTKAVTDAKKNGVEFSLPRRVEVGTAADLAGFLGTLTDEVPSLPSGDSFPSPLDTVYKKLTSLNLAVEELYLKVPPSLDAAGVKLLPIFYP